MRKHVLQIFIILAVTAAAGGSSLCQAQVPLPASLDTLYPPEAEQPIFLMKNLGLNMLFTGIVVDLFEDDLDHAKTNFEKFKSEYLGISKLVPEWKDEFPVKPVDELGASLETGDPGKVMAAVEKVGMICHSCHTANMVRAQQKYRWPDFQAIMVHDPLTDADADYAQSMQFLNSSFNGIAVDLEEGQVENAQKQFQGFKARFQALKESCGACHETERTYYVDEGVQSLIDKLGEALGGSSVDPKVVGELSQKIGLEGCSKCHMVHLPAAYGKLGWEKPEKVKTE
jgi:cytochrome c556